MGGYIGPVRLRSIFNSLSPLQFQGPHLCVPFALRPPPTNTFSVVSSSPLHRFGLQREPCFPPKLITFYHPHYSKWTPERSTRPTVSPLSPL